MSTSVRGGAELGWGDVARLARAIERTHRVIVVVTATVGPQQSCPLLFVWSARPAPDLENPVDPSDNRVWAWEVRVPSPDTENVCARVFSGGYSLDTVLSSKRWAQLPLPA